MAAEGRKKSCNIRMIYCFSLWNIVLYSRAYRTWTNTSKRQHSNERLTRTVRCNVTLAKATSQLTRLPFVQNSLNKCVLIEHFVPVKLMSKSSSFEGDDYLLKSFTLLPLIQSQSSNILSYYVTNKSEKHTWWDNVECIHLARTGLRCRLLWRE